MMIGRFLLAAVAGACAFWILIFLGATFDRGYDGSGVINWDAVVNGRFSSTYFTMLYVPPILMATCSYFALRRSKDR